MNETEIFYLNALGRAMRARNDALALAIYSEYKDYQNIFKPFEQGSIAS